MLNKLKEYKDKVATAKKVMDLQKKIGEITVEGTSGWGKLKVRVNGLQQMLACEIDAELLGDKAKLEKLVCEAANDAAKKLQQAMQERMKDLGGNDLVQELGDLMKPQGN